MELDKNKLITVGKILSYDIEFFTMINLYIKVI